MLIVSVMLSVVAFAQDITGTITDASGEPIIGASVQVKGTQIGAVTDFEGNFVIKGVKAGQSIVVSYVGYLSETVKIGNQKNIKVSLKEDTQSLEELVVVGYGTQKKSDVTGALTRVDKKVLYARPVSNAFEALQGKAAGVDITTNERPGELSSVLIRGSRSLTASNTPLYIVDGVPLMSASAIETLNPRNIKSINVLKDASATAIYGSRGANSVIIVATKQGKSGKFSLDYTGTLTLSNIVDRSPSMSAADYIQYRRWAAYNSDPSTYTHPDSPTKANDELIFNSLCDNNSSRDNVLKGWAGGS